MHRPAHQVHHALCLLTDERGPWWTFRSNDAISLCYHVQYGRDNSAPTWTQLEKKARGFAKLGSHAHTLILFASSPDANLAATVPVSAYAVFLGIKSIDGAREHLKNELKAAHGADFIPSTALTVSLSTGSFMWDQPDLPSHVSYFFCGDTL
jgi:hypothetical protein